MVRHLKCLQAKAVIMILNYLKIILRLLTRQKTFAFINIFGLTIGLVGFILILLFVRYEVNYDKHNQKLDRLYMVVRDVFLDNNVYNFTAVPYPFKDAVVAEYPEIEKATRIDDWSRYLFHFDDKTFDEPVTLADKEIFDMFTFNIIEGDARKPLPDVSSVAISKRTAEKYFGSEKAVGKVFHVNGQYDLTVTAVYDNLPPNSSLRQDIILPFDFYKTMGRDMTNWGSNATRVYLLLHKDVDVAAFEKKLEPHLGKMQTSDKPDKLFLHPYRDNHLHNFHYKGGAIQLVYLFSIIGVVILALAAINYVNLVTARSVRRAKEIGIRKTVGAEKSQVVIQFLGESILLSVIALNFAVLIVELLLPMINPVINKSLTIEYSNPAVLFTLLGIAILTGLIAGVYPAFYLTRFSPSAVLKNVAGVKGGSFKSALVIVQFSVSIALIITSIVLYKQLVHLKNLPSGFSRENVLFFKLENEALEHLEALQKDLSQIPAVTSISAASHLPSEIFSNGGGFTWEGKNLDNDVLISFTSVDHNYLKTFDIKLKEGRFFDANEVTLDTTRKVLKVVVNQRLVDITGFKEPLGKRLKNDSWSYEIIGVVNDFNFLQMRSEHGPLMISYNPQGTQFGFVKVSGDVAEVKKQLEARYSAMFPQLPPDFRLVEDRYQQYFGYESQNAKIFGYFTLLAIIISCLGLYGLASFIAEQRRKEMGIRKALGANTSGLSFLMLKDFAIWLIIANVIAIPLAWYYSNDLLSKYVFRTDISIWVFLLAAVISIFIATITVIAQVTRTAGQNPAVVLKYE